MAKKIVAGNWKMNLSNNEAFDLVNNLNDQIQVSDTRVILFPSSLYIQPISRMNKGKYEVGVQNFSANDQGAYTGEISIHQIRSVGGNIGLIGHSERREYNHEDHAILKAKVDQAVASNFGFIFCCGEPLSIRESGKQEEYVRKQLEESLFHLSKESITNGIIAYEPVWAIGTGMTASVEQAEEMHLAIRSWLTSTYDLETANSVSLLYGGSCKPSNAKELFACPNVDGGLIGGASLKADDFCQIINSF